MAGLHVPLSTLRRRPHGHRRMTRGHRGSLLLRCRAFHPFPPAGLSRRTHVHHVSIDGGSAQLFPGSLTRSTPQTFLVASTAGVNSRRWSRLTVTESRRELLPGPYPPGLSRFHACGGSATGSLALRIPVSLAGPGPSGSTD